MFPRRKSATLFRVKTNKLITQEEVSDSAKCFHGGSQRLCEMFPRRKSATLRNRSKRDASSSCLAARILTVGDETRSASSRHAPSSQSRATHNASYGHALRQPPLNCDDCMHGAGAWVGASWTPCLLVRTLTVAAPLGLLAPALLRTCMCRRLF